MAFRLYIVPIIGMGVKGDPRRPKYFADGTISANWFGVDYGIEAWMVVGADLTTQDDLTVTGQADAFAMPLDLSQPLTSQQVTNVQNKLEAIKLPAGWVDTTYTWQQVVRIVLGIMSYMQRFSALNGNVSLFADGTTLNSTINSLPVATRNLLTQTANEMGLSTTGITGSTQIRTALKLLGTQLQTMPYHFGSVVI